MPDEYYEPDEPNTEEIIEEDITPEMIEKMRDHEANPVRARDQLGRTVAFPDSKGTGSHAVQNWLRPLEAALQKAVTPEAITACIRELIRLSNCARSEAVRVEATKTVLGLLRQQQQQQVTNNNKHTTVNVLNMNKLSNDEIETLLKLTNKTVEGADQA